jgi:hypothetical protein
MNKKIIYQLKNKSMSTKNEGLSTRVLTLSQEIE